MSLERELRKDWDSVFYPAPDPIIEPMPEQAPGTSRPGDILVAEAGSRGLPESAFSGEVQAEMKSFDPTMRQQAADKLQSVLENLGVDRYKARQNAQSFIGGPSSNLPLNMGLVDALANLPGFKTIVGTAMLPMYTEEGALAIEEGIESAKRGDYVSAGIETVVGAVNALPGAQAAKDVGKSVVKKAKSLLKTVSAKDIPTLFSHGTSETSAESIMKSGKFDVSNADRKYTYSQFGRQAAYLTPEKGWWLDADRAANSRAITYESAIDAKIDPKAKIVRIDSEQELNQLAKKSGFVDAYDMMKSLDVDSLDYIKESRKAKSMTLLQFTSEMKKEYPSMSSKQIKEHYDEMRNFEEKAFGESDKATKQLIASGVDGIYISDKFQPSQFKNWHPASDQLAMFRPELIKPVGKRSLKNPTSKQESK